MSDAQSRPLWSALPEGAPGYMIAGSPITIASQFPDVGPGSTPVAFGNWKQAYTLVTRRAVTLQVDPYSAGYCILYKWDARIGGRADLLQRRKTPKSALMRAIR